MIIRGRHQSSTELGTSSDVLPALTAGMIAVFLRRGPWGYIHTTHPDSAKAHLRVKSLDELPQHLQALTMPQR